MNYYIQGNKEKADQIKAAFEKLGMSDLSGYNFGNGHALFYTYDCGGNKVIAIVCVSLHIADIIKTHPDYKELKLPVAPKFKVGDKVIYNGKQHTVTFVNDKYYGFSGGVAGCRIELQDQLLSPAPKPHYDISNFKPFDKVLVRCSNDEEWEIEFYCKYDTLVHTSPHRDYPFMGIGDSYSQCIPFEGNEHLLGTIDMCDEMYINW